MYGGKRRMKGKEDGGVGMYGSMERRQGGRRMGGGVGRR